MRYLPSRKLRALLTILVFGVTLSLCAQTPRNVILFIGDGMGFEHVKAARCYIGAPLSFENFGAQGQVTTRAANNAVTDSAAAATAMATGFKVNNGVISVALPGNSASLETTLEVFKKQGKATGLVTTSYLTDATPAAFGAHESSRTSTSAIATDFLTQSQPNILFGGGGNGLSATAATAAGYQVATTDVTFETLDPAFAKLCALFGTGAMFYEEDYPGGTYPYPHLTEMVSKALDALEHHANGFFLMVEAGRIDPASGTDTLPEMIHETLELSRSVQEALNWAGNRTDTLIVVIADHETGGLTVTQDKGPGNYPEVSWASSYAHTAANVPVYACGFGAQRFAGTLDNTYLHSLCTGEALSLPATVTLVPAGATWKYEASGTDLGTDWRASDYPDTGWLSGRAQLGYGDGDETWTITKTSPVYPCYYFRHAFDIVDPAAWSSLSLEILRDDGAVVYLNGQEVARYNMPAGTIAYGTWASSAGEFSWDAPLTIPNLLVSGRNVIAVEIHQSGSTSTDISLDLKLSGNVELAITQNAPGDGATGVANPATLTATPSDPSGNPVTVTFYGRPAPPSVPDFSIVVLPDTQNYTASQGGGTPAMFAEQTKWIVDNRASRNIAYAAHLGDISNNGDFYLSQWNYAEEALGKLDAAAVPYGLAVGNHDQYVPSGDTEPTTYFNQYFGTSRFAGRGYYGGHYGANNNNHYDLFSASGLNFIVIYFEYDETPDEAVLNWADALLKADSSRRGIVVTHYMIGTGGAWGAQGQAIYNALSDNPNLFLMLGGHISGEARRTDTLAGNTVHTLLSDYQGYSNGGNGFLRILRFSPGNNQIYVETYSPVTGQFETDDSSQFALSYTMQTGPAFQLLQQNTEVTSGTPTAATWSGLLPGTEYEWFAVADDGPERAISETRRFTTFDNVPPTITIASPVDGTSFATDPASVTITANAGDSDGTVAQVEFFVGSDGAGMVTAPSSYEVTTNLPCGAYTLTAVATDNEGSQTVSTPVHVTVGTPPAAPSGLTATAISRTAIQLAWVDNSWNEDGFQIYQVLNGSTYNRLGSVGANLTSANVSELQPSTTYTFVVRAFNAVGLAESDPITTTTLANLTPAVTDDNYTATEDSELVVAASGVLVNDTDEDGDPLSAVLDVGPTRGVLTLNKSGSFSYTPAPNFNGIDTFTYQASDGYASRAAATVTIEVRAVNDAPTAPANLSAIGSSGLVTLSWNASTDVDGDSVTYAVYRSEVSGSYGDPIASLTGLSYPDRAVMNGTTYFYRVVAVDSAAAHSAASIEVSATPDNVPVDVFVSQNPTVIGTLAGDYTATFEADGVAQTITEVPISTGSRLQADYILASQAPPVGILELSLFLNAEWTGLDGAADPLVISIWNYASGAWEQITADVQDGEFVAAEPQNYISADGIMQVRFTDSASIKREKKDTLRIDSLFARFVTGEPDTTPPSAPASLSASGADCSVTLVWTANLETDLGGYNIYRSTSPNGEYDLVNPAAPFAANAYVDSGLANSVTYHYVVTAVDQSGNESGPSAMASATPVDGPPAPPIEVTATAGDGQVVLNWADNTEPDLVGYKVYCVDGTQSTLLATASTSEYSDTGLANGTSYSYRVTAVDNVGNESAYSSVVGAIPAARITMHVKTIDIGGLIQAGKSYKASGAVLVVDAANATLASANVTAEWWLNSGGASSLLQTQLATTGADGTAAFTSPPVKAPSGSTFTLRVTNVALTGYEFAPSDGASEATSQPVP